jgi:F-type H+-transporting ATPase subunit epsilon
MLSLKVLSPERTVLNIDCNAVTMPSSEGQITVYPRHAPIYTLVTHGELIVHTDKDDLSLAIGPGFAEINGTGVTVLTDYGVSSDEIDAVRAQEAKERAEQIIKDHRSETDMVLAQAELLRSLVELKVVSKKKG